MTGCAGLLVGHPFDTVKIHLQTQDFRNPQYRGVYHCLKSIIVKDTVRGLYRGLSSPLAGVAFINAIVFGVYGNAQRLSANPNSYKTHFLAGATAGLIQSLICSPMELAKTRLQLQTNQLRGPKFTGPLLCLSYIYRCEGLRGIFKGLGITALRDIPGFASYFVSYEFLIRLRKDPGIGYTLLAGGLAGITSWVFVIPIDVVKSRIQADGITTGKRMYNGMYDCFAKSYKAEGASFFTRGLSSTLLRAFPMNAVCFLVVSSILKFCDNTSIAVTLPNTKLSIIGNSFADCPHRKRQTVQGLLYIGAFSEAICSSEIIEIANDLYDCNGANNNSIVSFSLNNDSYLQFSLQPKLELPSIENNIALLNE